MNHLSLAASFLFLTGPAFAVTTWVTPSGAANSNVNFPGGSTYSNNFGIVFKTGSAGPFSMDWLTLGLNSSSVAGGPTVSLKVALRNATSSTAYLGVAGTTEYALDTVSFTLPGTTATNFNLELDFADLLNVSAYELQADTAYALLFYAPSHSIGFQRRTGHANGTTNNYYTTTEGFAVLDTFRNNSANYQNNTTSFPSLAISFGGTSAVPEPGQSVALTAFLASSLLLRARRRPLPGRSH